MYVEGAYNEILAKQVLKTQVLICGLLLYQLG